MRIDQITIDDFRSYGHADINLTPLRLASIVGENGAGKSSIMDAAVFCLTGARTRGNLDDWIRDDQEETRVSTIFAPSANGHRYRVTRTRSRRNSGKSTAELSREENGVWVADCTGAKDVDARIRELLGADEELLLMTSFISQDEAKRFLELTPSRRLEVLGEILKLDEEYGPLEKHFKVEADKARAELEATRRDVTRLESEVETLDGREAELVCAKAELDRAKADLETAEREGREAHERAEAAKAAIPNVDEVRERLRELDAKRGSLIDRQSALGDERGRLIARTADKTALLDKQSTRSDVEAALSHLAAAEKADAETRQKRAVLDTELRSAKQTLLDISGQGKPKAAELERLKGQWASLNDRVSAIRSAEVPVCDRCGQEIADEALAQTLAQLESELDDTTRRRDELQYEVEDLRAQLAEQKLRCQSLDEEIASLPPLAYDPAEDRRLKNLVEELNEIPAKLATIAAAEERLVALASEIETVSGELADPALDKAMDEARAALAGAEEKTEAWRDANLADIQAAATVGSARHCLSEAEKAVARHEEAIGLLSASRDQLKDVQKHCRELEQAQADADLLRRAFSKWGIPALIIGNVLLALEREVNELMGLYESGMTVRFESTKETRDGSRDSLEIVIDRAGTSRSYSTFSGGEKYRIASCIRLGLALLMAHRAGARIGTLILDEPEGLDAEGRLHLVRILEHLSAQFERVLLISHHDDLKDAMPSQLVVSRGDDGLSHVEVCA
jgi:exonuclease SbcC